MSSETARRCRRANLLGAGAVLSVGLAAVAIGVTEINHGIRHLVTGQSFRDGAQSYPKANERRLAALIDPYIQNAGRTVLRLSASRRLEDGQVYKGRDSKSKPSQLTINSGNISATVRFKAASSGQLPGVKICGIDLSERSTESGGVDPNTTSITHASRVILTSPGCFGDAQLANGDYTIQHSQGWEASMSRTTEGLAAEMTPDDSLYSNSSTQPNITHALVAARATAHQVSGYLGALRRSIIHGQ